MENSSKTLADQVYIHIKNEILRGSLAFGEIIREDQLAAKYGVSRTPVREALKSLSEYGLVKIAPRSHATIAKISEKESRNIAEVRIALEQFAIRNMKKDILQKRLSILTHYAASCERALERGEKEPCFELDSQFHICLVDIAGNATLSELYRHLDARIQLLRVKQGLSEGTLKMFIAQHGELLFLLQEERTEEAAALIRYHILHEKA